MKRLIDSLTKISKIPATGAAEWLSSAESSIEFIKENTQSERLVLFASMPHVLIHAVLAPLKNLDPPDQDDLSHDFIYIDASWRIEHASGGGEPDRVYLAPALGSHGKTLKGGEKLFFKRSFSGSDARPIELSQKLVHALDLHFIAERKAYCRLDADGDLEDVISIVGQSSGDWTEDVTIVTILAKDFGEYMRLSDMGMVVFFDFTRVPCGFNGWAGERHFDHKARDLFYNGGVMPGHASYVNGRLVVRPAITMGEIVQAHKDARDGSKRQYAVFKAINLKTGKRIEVSCDPAGLSNYFQRESTLPLEMSPAFFKAELLHRYKADQEKYDLRDRSISCRGTWSLKTYDINDAGQVHTYLRYLRQLPYKEQVYWQSFNEWPKGPISKRALATDFKGEWHTEYDALNALRYKIHSLDDSPPGWWSPRGEKLAGAVHYPATAASTEWANEILALDQLLIEGFRSKNLKTLARELSRTPQPEWQSLKLLEECLIGSGLDKEEAAETISPFRALHELRTVVKGHAAPEKKQARAKEAIAGFGSFRAHFTQMAADCDSALEVIIERLKALPGCVSSLGATDSD
jgi:hypothetical protein